MRTHPAKTQAKESDRSIRKAGKIIQRPRLEMLAMNAIEESSQANNPKQKKAKGQKRGAWMPRTRNARHMDPIMDHESGRCVRNLYTGGRT